MKKLAKRILKAILKKLKIQINPPDGHLLMGIWWRNDTRTINITNFKKIRAENRKNYPDDPDINKDRRWGTHSNGAQKGNPRDSCLDYTIRLGHIEFNYINWTYNEKLRNKEVHVSKMSDGPANNSTPMET